MTSVRLETREQGQHRHLQTRPFSVYSLNYKALISIHILLAVADVGTAQRCTFGWFTQWRSTWPLWHVSCLRHRSPGGQAREDGEEALQAEQVHGAQRGADGKRGLGQQRRDALEQVAALDAAVQVQVHVADEARLVAEVQDALAQIEMTL